MAPYQLGRSFADMMYFDTHAHLTDERFDADRAALMEVLPKRGLAFALDVACALQDFPKTHALTQAYSWVFGAYGVHPHYAGEVPTGYLDMIQEALDDPKAKRLAKLGSTIIMILRRALCSAAYLPSSLSWRNRLIFRSYCIFGKLLAIAWKFCARTKMGFVV